MASGRADNYRAALTALEQQRADYLNQINELDALIAGIKRQIQLAEGTAEFSPTIASKAMNSAQNPASVDPNAFKNMSVRWGILKLLGERPGTSLSTSEMAKMLEEGGLESGSQRFVGNVSAVVSAMKQRDELDAEDGRYQLTENGRRVWEHIQRSPKYLNRLSPNAA